MKAIIIDDDPFFCDAVKGYLNDLEIDVECYTTLGDFELSFPDNEPNYLIIDLAIPPDGSQLITALEAKGGHSSGVAAIRKIKKTWHNSKIALITGGPAKDARKWCEQNNVVYMVKPIERTQIEQFIGIRKLRAFVVHGHNQTALRKAKKILKEINVDPIVLMEMPNQGRTVIEKFEEVSAQCDLAFIIMTPDDIGILKGKPMNRAQMRCRQNVIFELGYFCGALGRNNGRVNIIEFGETEIPSDIAGIIRFDGKKSTKTLKADFEKEIGFF